MKQLFLSAWLLLAVAAPLGFAAQDDRTNRLDDLFRPWSESGTPGASVAVIQHGEVLVQKGYGLANLEYDIPVTPQTV